MDTVTQTPGAVTVGVDTHRDFHVAAVTDHLGTVLETATFEATANGYHQLRGWVETFGPVNAVGVEGTGSWGKGLTRHLTDHDLTVIEVIRPNRQTRRRYGKTDTIDAIAAARAVLNGEATSQPRTTNGPIESLRLLKIARRSAKRHQTAVANQINAIIVTAPEPLRSTLQHHTTLQRVATAARYRPGDPTNPYHAAKHALKALARRHQHLTQELNELDHHVTTLTTTIAPKPLLAETGIGPVIASDLLITAGTNPHRLHSEAAFAALCGVSAVDASSGQQTRHRLNRGGDRQANAALHRAVIVRLRYHQPTRDYMTKRLTQGKTRRETIRCLKRLLARKIYRHITKNPPSHL